MKPVVVLHFFFVLNPFGNPMEIIKLFPRKQYIYECIRTISQCFHGFGGLTKSIHSPLGKVQTKEHTYKFFGFQDSSTFGPGQNFVANTSLHSFPFFSSLCFLFILMKVSVQIYLTNTLRQESEVTHFPFRISCTKGHRQRKVKGKKHT